MMMGSRRSSRVSKVENSNQEEEDEIEIVGDTEMEKKNAERVDKNFSKMTLKGQREAMEAFKSSTLYSTEEEEEEEEEEEQSKEHKKVGTKKRKVMVESGSDSDIEVLESPKSKKGAATNKSSRDGKVADEEKEMKVSKRKNDFDEKLLTDEHDKQKPEFVQVNSICIDNQTNNL